MQRTFLLVLILSFSNFTVDSQKERSNYLNFGYVKQDFKSSETSFLSMQSDNAVSLSWGHTFYLTRKPIFKCIRLGIDWTFLDLDLADYTTSFQQNYSSAKSSIYQLTAGMQIGPSLQLNPIAKLNLHLYYHFAPAYSFIGNREFKPYAYNYINIFTTGVGISYKLIFFGAEKRWGNTTYRFTTTNTFEEINTFLNDWNTQSLRFYIGFRY
ncbi:MAG: hypothetical protein ACOYOT_11040 [Bacteroidales bacterium]